MRCDPMKKNTPPELEDDLLETVSGGTESGEERQPLAPSQIPAILWSRHLTPMDEEGSPKSVGGVVGLADSDPIKNS